MRWLAPAGMPRPLAEAFIGAPPSKASCNEVFTPEPLPPEAGLNEKVPWFTEPLTVTTKKASACGEREQYTIPKTASVFAPVPFMSGATIASQQVLDLAADPPGLDMKIAEAFGRACRRPATKKSSTAARPKNRCAGS